jgi:hypothetical protein
LNLQLIKAVRKASKTEPQIGKKLPDTSACFTSGRQDVVWGQCGLNPHALNERHYIPSIMPNYQSLTLSTIAEALRIIN